MVPTRYLDELKAQPETKISNKKALILVSWSHSLKLKFRR